MVGIDIAGGSPGQIDVVVGEGESGARIFMERIEVDLAVGSSCAPAWHRCRDQFGASEFFDARSDGQRMEVLKIFIVADRVADGSAGQHIECSGLYVNDGR